MCVCVWGGGGGNAHFILQKWERGMYSAGKESGERGIFSAGKANRKDGCFLLEKIADERRIFC